MKLYLSHKPNIDHVKHANMSNSTPRGTYDSTLRCKDRDMLFLRLRTWMFVHRLSESVVHIGTLQLVQATTPTGGYTAPWLRKQPQGWTKEAGCTALLEEALLFDVKKRFMAPKRAQGRHYVRANMETSWANHGNTMKQSWKHHQLCHMTYLSHLKR